MTALPSDPVDGQRVASTSNARNSHTQRLYVAGGQQRTLRGLTADMDSWYEYQKGVILAVDTVAQSASVAVEYESPPDVRPAVDPAILFKSGVLVGDLLYTTTQTEVLVYRVP